MIWIAHKSIWNKLSDKHVLAEQKKVSVYLSTRDWDFCCKDYLSGMAMETTRMSKRNGKSVYKLSKMVNQLFYDWVGKNYCTRGSREEGDGTIYYMDTIEITYDETRMVLGVAFEVVAWDLNGNRTRSRPAWI